MWTPSTCAWTPSRSCSRRKSSSSDSRTVRGKHHCFDETLNAECAVFKTRHVFSCVVIGHFLDTDQLLSALVQIPKQETVCALFITH